MHGASRSANEPAQVVMGYDERALARPLFLGWRGAPRRIPAAGMAKGLLVWAGRFHTSNTSKIPLMRKVCWYA